jgi:hypothetical protein
MIMVLCKTKIFDENLLLIFVCIKNTENFML